MTATTTGRLRDTLAVDRNALALDLGERLYLVVQPAPFLHRQIENALERNACHALAVNLNP